MISLPESQTVPSAANPATRPLYWSVRREMWENRSIVLAPLAVAAVIVFGFILSTFGLPQRRRALMALSEARQRASILEPYNFAAFMLIATAFLVGAFYCLDALYGERRDRSVLFWKSLPVSDKTTVVAKAAIPYLVLPSVIYLIIAFVQLFMLFWSSFVLLVNGVSAELTWKYFPVAEELLILLYAMVVIALWHAPIYAWFLMISAWAKRATFLWAVLPPIALAILERIAFETNLVAFAIRYRLAGFMNEALDVNRKSNLDSLAQLTPGHFLVTPGLWTGLGFAAVFLFVAMRLRRDREPL